jgi:hypothetical protein
MGKLYYPPWRRPRENQQRRIQRQCFAKERLCGRDPTVATKQEAHRLAVLVDGPVQIVLSAPKARLR